MRRTGLVLALAMLGMAVPASAEATTFQGSCQFLHTDGAFGESTYALSNANGSCNGSLNGGPTEGFAATLTSSGSGAFSCEGGTFATGEGEIGFYRYSGQARVFADTLTITEGPGLAAGTSAARRVAGEKSGLAIERSAGSGFCGLVSRRIDLQTVQTLVD